MEHFIFTINIIMQSISYIYIISIILKLFFNKNNYNKRNVFFTSILVFFIIFISEMIKKYIPLVNILIIIILLTLNLKYITKLDTIKSIFTSISMSSISAVSELITVILVTNTLHCNTTYLLDKSYRIFFIVLLQNALFILLTKYLVTLFNKYKEKFNINITNITSKQIILFVVLLIIYIFPQMILLITNQYDYSNLFLFISTIQFILIFIFISIFLNNSIKYDRNQKELYASELQNKTLFSLIESINNLKHDFKNILSSFKGYISTKKYDKLEQHVDELLLEYDISNNFYSIDKKVFNEPAIYGLLGTKYFLAIKYNILFEFKIEIDLTKINFSIPNLSRILGILIDNSIEATKDLSNPYIRLEMTYDKKRLADKIKIINTYNTNIKIDINKIYEKGFSTKKIKSGIGLYEVKKIINKSKNSTINTTIEHGMFIQTILIDK